MSGISELKSERSTCQARLKLFLFWYFSERALTSWSPLESADFHWGMAVCSECTKRLAKQQPCTENDCTFWEAEKKKNFEHLITLMYMLRAIVLSWSIPLHILRTDLQTHPQVIFLACNRSPLIIYFSAPHKVKVEAAHRGVIAQVVRYCKFDSSISGI